MEQKTEASQAVERRDEYDAFCEWVRETPSKPFSDMAWEAWKDGRARLRAALKAQPAPTEAPTQPCWSCNKPYTLAQRSYSDGRCPHCDVDIELEDEAPTEAAQGAQLSGNSGELQPSGNTGEAAQGEYSFSKPKGWINLANPGQSWEQWTKAQGIPTTRGWKISAQGEDSARLDWSSEQSPSSECSYHHVTAQTPFGRILITWKGWKDDPSPTVDEHPVDGYFYVGDDVADAKENAERAYFDAIDRARASAETGGVKP